MNWSNVNWATVIGTLVSGGLLAGGFQLALGLLRRGNNKADAVAVLTQAVGQFAEDVNQQRESDRREWEAERTRSAGKIRDLEQELTLLRSRQIDDAAQARESQARIRELEEELRTIRLRVRDLERQNDEKDATIVKLRASNGHPFG